MVGRDTELKKDKIVCNFSSCENIYNMKVDISSLKTSNLFNICLVVPRERRSCGRKNYPSSVEKSIFGKFCVYYLYQ